jgi:hypothetical protein
MTEAEFVSAYEGLRNTFATLPTVKDPHAAAIAVLARSERAVAAAREIVTA